MFKKLLSVGIMCVALSILGIGQEAGANQLKFELQAVVPMKCDAKLQGSKLDQIDVSRSCNVAHKIEIKHPHTATRGFKGSKGLKIQYEGKDYTIKPGSAISIMSGPVSKKLDTLKIIKPSGQETTKANNLQFQITPL